MNSSEMVTALNSMVSAIESLKALVTEQETVPVVERAEYVPSMPAVLASLVMTAEALNVSEERVLCRDAYRHAIAAIDAIVQRDLTAVEYERYSGTDVNWGGGQSWYDDLLETVSDCLDANNEGDFDGETNGYVDPSLDALLDDEVAQYEERGTANTVTVDTLHLTIEQHGLLIGVHFNRSSGEQVRTFINPRGNFNASQVVNSLRDGSFLLSNVPGWFISSGVESTAANIGTVHHLIRVLCDRGLLYRTTDDRLIVGNGASVN